jgi:hypothetical protein
VPVGLCTFARYQVVHHIIRLSCFPVSCTPCTLHAHLLRRRDVSFKALVHPDKALDHCRCGPQLQVLRLGQAWDAGAFSLEVLRVYGWLSKA